jgi:hypothetical protein
MYLCLDAGFTSSAAIEELGEAHGPAGPMIVVSLLGMAKQQGWKGAVKTTRRKLADDAFVVDRDLVDVIVRQAVEIGVLEAIELDARTIHVRFVRWESWQKRLSDAERQALKRAREGNGAVDA